MTPAPNQARDILTITLNPSLDRATIAPELLAGPKLRCEAALVDPGGGGINVARAIGLLGGRATALVAVAGPTGAELLSRLSGQNTACIAFQGPGETRQSLSVTDRSSGQQYRFVLPGPDWSDADVARALIAIEQATRDDMLVILSGSQPPGVAKKFPSTLAAHVVSQGARLVVDTSGPALKALAGEANKALDTLRMDDVEAEDLAGRALRTRVETADFCSSLVAAGVARTVIVARGADGNVLANADGRLHAIAPQIEVVSAVGAGDSFVGAYCLAVAQGIGPGDALMRATATASAACMSPATRLCDPADVAAQLADTVICTL